MKLEVLMTVLEELRGKFVEEEGRLSRSELQ
jgi:hypothetical protein